jgi:HlyD family secretion protein
MRPEAIDVDVAVVSRGPLRITIDEDGQTRIRRHAEIAAPVSGRLAESMVTVGDSVRAGAVVARLSPAPLDPRARDEAEAALRQATALTREARARMEQAQLALEDARKARTRAERLAASGGLATRDVEQAVMDVRLRERDVEAATSHQAAATQEERRARAAVMPTDPSRMTTGLVTLTSPMAGRVLRVFEEHDRVVPAGTRLIEVGDLSTVEVLVDVLSRDASSVAPGFPMVIRGGTGREYRASVARIEPAAFTKVSPLGVEEQRVNVVGRFEEAPVGLGDRFEVEVQIVLWQSDSALSLPVTALVPIDTTWAVYVVVGGRVTLRRVQIGRRGSIAVEVLSGVSAGDSTVAYPDERLQAGGRVHVVRRR